MMMMMTMIMMITSPYIHTQDTNDDNNYHN